MCQLYDMRAWALSWPNYKCYQSISYNVLKKMFSLPLWPFCHTEFASHQLFYHAWIDIGCGPKGYILSKGIICESCETDCREVVQAECLYAVLLGTALQHKLHNSTNTNIYYKNYIGLKLREKGNPELLLCWKKVCVFIQEYIHLSMMIFRVMGFKIHTHLSSHCIITSYFCKTLTPSGVSKHLKRRKQFKSHAKLLSEIVPGANDLKTSVHEEFKAACWAIITADGWPSWSKIHNLLYWE